MHIKCSILWKQLPNTYNLLASKELLGHNGSQAAQHVGTPVDDNSLQA